MKSPRVAMSGRNRRPSWPDHVVDQGEHELEDRLRRVLDAARHERRPPRDQARDADEDRHHEPPEDDVVRDDRTC